MASVSARTKRLSVDELKTAWIRSVSPSLMDLKAEAGRSFCYLLGPIRTADKWTGMNF